MKTAVFAFFGIVASAFSAKVDLSTLGGVMASGHVNVIVAAAADEHSGAASGSVDGHRLTRHTINTIWCSSGLFRNVLVTRTIKLALSNTRRYVSESELKT